MDISTLIDQLDALVREGRQRVAIADAYVNMGQQFYNVAEAAGNTVGAVTARRGLAQARDARERAQGSLDLAILQAHIARTDPSWFGTAAI